MIPRTPWLVLDVLLAGACHAAHPAARTPVASAQPRAWGAETCCLVALYPTPAV